MIAVHIIGVYFFPSCYTLHFKMVAENKAAQRQSSALLASVGNDKKLTESLKKIEELSRELEESKYKHKEEVWF